MQLVLGSELLYKKKRLRWSRVHIIKHYAMKTYRGVKVQLHTFLTSALVRGQWSALSPGRFSSGKEPRCPLNWKLGGPQRGSRRCWKEKIS
jgi:hypothetical protein